MKRHILFVLTVINKGRVVREGHFPIYIASKAVCFVSKPSVLAVNKFP